MPNECRFKNNMRIIIIHSFIHGISIAPLRIHYYSDVLSTPHGHCVGVSPWSATGNCEWRTCQGPYMAARAGSEPTTFGRKASNLPMSHHTPHIILWDWLTSLELRQCCVVSQLASIYPRKMQLISRYFKILFWYLIMRSCYWVGLRKFG